MEPRNIVIVSSKTQAKYVVNSTATTLGELKADLRTNGIDYSNLIFYEGLTHTEMVDDTSLLPKDVMRNGEPTNNLVFRLYPEKKNIKSGAIDRKELYHIINENDLKQDIKRIFGTDFTHCKNYDLEKFLSDRGYLQHIQKDTFVQSTIEPKECVVLSNGSILEHSFITLVNILSEKGIITAEDKEKINSKPDSDCPYSEQELNEILNGCFYF